MQVFVLRADLTMPNPPVIASYPPFPMMDRNKHGTECAVLSLPEATVVQADVSDPTAGIVTELVFGWRTMQGVAEQVINDEARRRIDESFAEYMQRNALWGVQYFVTQLGLPMAGWGATEQSFYAKALQGWQYVSDVRNKSNDWIPNMPTDPTADENWPPRIAVIDGIALPAVP